MFIIAGLGNPGKEYEGTRHNAGFDVIDALADKYNISVTERKNLTVSLYTEELDCDGETLEYIKFTFRHAKGKPVEYSIKDGEFLVPELTLRSRAKTGESGVEIEALASIE